MRRPQDLLLLQLLLCADAAQALRPNPAQSVLLTRAASEDGAVCLDGTPQRIWIAPAAPGSANATRWAWHFMGGGWCSSVADCAARAYSPKCYLGSSNASCFAYQAPGDAPPNAPFAETMDFADIPSCLNARWCGGLMVNDPASNPMTHDWNRVLVSYCDGMSYAGDAAEPLIVSYNGSSGLPLYFRGARNVRAILAELTARFGLGAATDLVLSGDSAGGLASYWHADFIAAALPRARVVAAPDSGFFFTDSAYAPWAAELAWIAAAGNLSGGSGGLNARCVAAQRAAGADPLLCARVQVAAPHISTPLFVMNSMYDPALDSISGGEGGGNATNVQRLGDELAALVAATVLNRPANGAFLTGCRQHCGQWAQGQTGPFADFNVTIDDTTAVPALMGWWSGSSSQRLWKQAAQFPCATCCSGGQQ